MATAVVAATLNRRRRDEDRQDEIDFALDGMLEDPQTFQSRMASVKSVLEDLKSISLFGPTDDARKESESKVHALLEKRDSQILYGIESSLLVSLVADLPSQSVLNRVFKDRVCGDGVCDRPAEFPGFGRFGCIPDCGKYPNLTTVSLSLRDVIADSGTLLGWDLTLSDSSLDPSRSKFTYNIYSYTMNVFEKDIYNETVSFELPDGEYTLVLRKKSRHLT
ncbi:hypothetical protein GUITHDRAFT_146313 [Guillardia theta CCMP2712]|uniref:Uncharacterized protein n=1 Tax=Guillardia theta (strain CCMP2712) TaxID=905079 RepID=L1IHU4_GUITC|nr:hypothetical protein GUITHDRAFT_146313 [Guillardia theta CCMP2712]EKX35677.1 hypothetical protein GUITHDRAFT_146313 [Guillardia theta CCMP2712]|eukprot:XP_005822657.1 hypothetical protein GUITHDRAFT_146313 [Guillardia theta CCMP2712]